MTSLPLDDVDTQVIAERVIYEALGRRWVRPMRAVDAYPVSRDLFLTGRPVIQIFSITAPDKSLLDTTDYELAGGFRIRFSLSVAQRYTIEPLGYRGASRNYGEGRGGYYGDPFEAIGHCYDREFIVDYSYGSLPNDMIVNAIMFYRDQLDLAIQGSDECRLPQRVTSISRQGISMTVLDPLDFLQKGMTGLPEVDSVISVFNPATERGARAHARARLFTDRNPPARRISVTPIDAG